MRLFAGIDGGQSSTTALVGDASGNVLGRGVAGPADEVGQGAGSTRLRDALQGALASALGAASLPPDTRVEAVVAGISGFDGRVRGAAPVFNAERVELLHDAPIAHAGALDGAPGIAIVAGTGSVVYGRAEDGRTVTTGGWGYLFGDEGSAFWIARRLIETATLAEDCDLNGRDATLQPEMLEFFGVPSLRALARAFYAGEFGRERVAAFAEPALKRRGAHVETIVRTGVVALADQATLAAARLGMTQADVAVVGGLMRSPVFAAAIEEAIKAEPRLRPVAARHPPAVGALMLAAR